MRKIREILRLRLDHGLAQRVIGQSLGLSQAAISEYLGRARMAGLSWPLPDDLDDERLEALLFPPVPDVPHDQRPVPDWSAVHRDLRRPNMTLALVWEEYRAASVNGFGYSWFCDLYRDWAGRLKPTLRQVHTAGEQLFVDFTGQTMEVIDGATGEVTRAEIFVAVLGASSFILETAVGDVVFGMNRCIIRGMTHDLSVPSFHPTGGQLPVEDLRHSHISLALSARL
jgi:hypothetical protein